MRYFMISDIHGNVQGLTAVLNHMVMVSHINAELKEKIGDNLDDHNLPIDPNFVNARSKVSEDVIVCLGDIVGYGARPAECTRIISKVAPTVRGNHEEYMRDLSLWKEFHDELIHAWRWTQDVLEKDGSLDLLMNMTRHYSFKDRNHIFSHGLPDNPRRFSYADFERSDTVSLFADPNFDEKTCFVGHSHVPGVFMKVDSPGNINYRIESPLTGGFFNRDLKEFILVGSTHVVSIPSVGQPRDRNPRAGYAVFDSDIKRLTFHRVDYDVYGAMADITNLGRLTGYGVNRKGIDSFFAERLIQGR